MAADPEDHRHTVLWCSAQRGPPRLGARPGCYAAPLAVNGLHPHQPAARAARACSPRRRSSSAARSTRSPGRSASRSGPTPSRSGRRRWRARRPPRRRGCRGAGSTSAARSTTRGRASSTSRGTCRSPGREPATDAQLDEIADAHHGGRRADARAVLVAPRGERGGGRHARAARRPDPRAGRRPAADPRLAVHRRRGHVPVRDAVALAGRRRPGPDVPAGHHRPHPVPAAGRPGAAPRGPTRSRRPAATGSWPCPPRTRRCCSPRAPAG